MKEAILQADPPADISVAIAWIHMLPPDNAAAARRMALALRDPRVQHFHDPHKRAGAAVAGSLGAAEKLAWDIYLFYPAGVGWQYGPPRPVMWVHQLKGSSWADPSRHHRGEELVRHLEMALVKLRTCSEMARLPSELRESDVMADEVWELSRNAIEARA